MNSVAIIGNLTADPELKHTADGTAVVNFTVAVNEKYGTTQNTYWINCVAWRKSAELLHQYFHKGNKVGVEGKLTTRSYEDRNGKKVTVTEVVVNNITFIESRAKVDAPVSNEPVVVDDLSDLPF